MRRSPETDREAATAAGAVTSRRPGPAAVAWVVLAAAVCVAAFSTRFPPLYDYYQWLFQGHVTSSLLFGDAADFHGQYTLSPVPVPNLAAPLVIAVLNTVLPIELAGRVFLALTACGFAGGYGFLVRSVQRRPTAVEFLGFVWALGFFAYKGYLSFLFGLGLAFVLVAVLHRATAGANALTGRRLAAVCALGALVYLAHLVAWTVCAVGVAVYAVVCWRRGRRRTAGALVATLLPAVAAGLWYLLAEHGGAGITLYPAAADKAISLAETLQPFLRLDPFPPSFPIFWLNVLVVVVLAVLVVAGVDRTRLRVALRHRPVLWLAAALALLALVLPISMVNELIKPDERYVLPALLLAAAALPYRRTSPRALPRALPAAAVALGIGVIGLHTVEYVAVGHRIAAQDHAVDAAIPPGQPMLSLSIASRYGCAPASGPSVGVPTLKWFGVDEPMEHGRARVNVDETSLVHSASTAPPSVQVLTPTTAEVPATVAPLAGQYPFVLVVACPSDLDAAARDLAPVYQPVSAGEGFLLLRNDQEPADTSDRLHPGSATRQK